MVYNQHGQTITFCIYVESENNTKKNGKEKYYCPCLA